MKNRNLLLRCLFIFSLVCFYLQGNATLINSNAVTGNWSSTTSWVGGIVPTANDTAVIVNTAIITVDNNSCIAYKLRVNNGGTVNVSSNTLTLQGGSVTINVLGTDYTYIGNGSLWINTSGTFNLQTGTLKMTGSFFNYGNFNCGTGTVVFDTKNAVIGIGGSKVTTFHHIINNDSVRAYYPIQGGFGVSLHTDNTIITGDVVINGSFNRNSSAVNDTVDITFAGITNLSGAYSFYLNNVVINAGSTLNANNKNINMYGNWTSNGNFLCGTGTVSFLRDPNNQLAQNIYQANPDLNPFYNIIVNKSTGSVTQLAGALNLNGNIYISNNFTVTKGTYDMGGVHRLYVAGNFFINGPNGGIFTASAGRLLMNGASLVTAQSLNTGGSSLYKFTIDNSGAGVQLASDVTITYEMVLQNGLMKTKNGLNVYEIFLSNNTAASLPTYSSSSYVVGKLRRSVVGANNYTFPLGPMNTGLAMYRPIAFQQTAAGGASNILMFQDTISNAGTYRANWWTNIQPDAGTPTGTINFSYNLGTDFLSGTSECAISSIRGALPPPANWNFVLTNTVAPAGGNSGIVTVAMPASFSPYAYILGEVSPVASGVTICSGNTATLNVTSPAGSGTYNWYDALTGGNLLQSNSISYTTPVLNDTVTYYVEHQNSLTACTSHRTSVTVIVKPTPTSLFTVSDSICVSSGTPVTFTGSANTGAAYTWNFDGGTIISGSGQGPYSVDWSSTGIKNITLSVLDNGCTSTLTSHSIVVGPSPVATFNVSSVAACAGDTLQIGFTGLASVNAYYNWNFDSGNIISGSGQGPYQVSWSSAGTKNISLTLNDYHCSDLNTQNITINPLPTIPTITVSDDTICQGDIATITASGSTGGTITYNFYDAAVSGSLVGTSPLTVNPSVTTVYYLEVINSTGCLYSSSRIPVTIFVAPKPTIPTVIVSDDTICAGELVTITASGSTGGIISYNFYDAATGGTFIGSSPLTMNPTTTTTYYLEVINSYGCLYSTVRTPVTIFVAPAPTAAVITVSDDTICAGESATITASGSTGGTITYNFYDAVSGGTLLGTSPLIVSPTTTSTYYLEVINENGCLHSTIRTPVTIVVNPLPDAPVVTTTNLTICEGDSTTITATVNPASAVITWWNSQTGGNLLATGNSYNTGSLANSTSYWLQATSAEGCENNGGRVEVTIIVNSLPLVSLTNDLSGSTIYDGQIVTFTASPATYSQYNFYINNVLSQSGSSNIFPTNALQNGDTVSVIVNDGYCSSTFTEMILDITPIPNAFTPDGDGINDLFLKGLDIVIINQWGQELYSGKEGWDGTYNGTTVSRGTYYYILTRHDTQNNEIKVKGSVLLIK